MSPTVALHIGPFKTGTTSLQGALSRISREAPGAPFTYPVAHRAIQHERAMLAAVLSQPRPSRQSPFVTKYVSDLWLGNRRRFNGNFDAMVGRTRRSDLPVVLSAEIAALLRPDGAIRVLNALGASRVHVVVTGRPVSELIPSWYQQVAKQQVLPSLEAFTRSILAEMLDHRDPEATPWMDISWLRSVWTPGDSSRSDVTFHVVPTSKSDPTRALRGLLATIGIEMDDLDRYMQVENVAENFTDVIAWQRWMAEQGDCPIWMLNRLRGDFMAAMNADLNRYRDFIPMRPSLTTEAKTVVDAAFPVIEEGGREEALDVLRERLRDPTRVTVDADAVDPDALAELLDQVSARLRAKRRLLSVLSPLLVTAARAQHVVASRQSRYLDMRPAS